MSTEPSGKATSSLQAELDAQSAIEDARLVQSIVEGDRDAEQAFVTRYQRPLRAMLLARSRNPDLAADLLQDALIESLCSLRRGLLRDPAKLTVFVMAIGRNVLNSHFRGEAHRPEWLEFPDNLPDLSTATDRVEEQERELLALHAISSLDSVDKAILQMTLVDGLKPGVIAGILQLSPDVVRQRKVRATRRVIEFMRNPSQTHSATHFISGMEK